MNRKDKHFISFLLVCVIILNTLYGSRKRTEGFIKATVEGVLNIVPIKPIRKFLQKEVKKDEKFYVEDGTVEFSDNNLLVLSASALSLKDINSEQISSMRKDAEKKLSTNQVSDKQKYILNYKVETLKQLN